jgi:hypothetical protein
MKYMLQFYSTPEEFAARETPEGQKVFRGSFVPYMKALQDAGVVVVGAGLQKPGTATSLRINGNGSHHVQDGPFADTKEQLAGFFIIDVPNMDAALKWAARYPGGPGGGVEVRPALQQADLDALHKMLAEA